MVLHEKAADLLAPLDPDTIKVLTAASSHMTAALRLVNYAGECAVVAPDLGSEYDISLLLDNGKLSKAKVEQTCPGISEYLRDGISYFTVRYPLAELCPLLMKILSASDNAGHDTFRREIVVAAVDEPPRQGDRVGGINRRGLDASWQGHDARYLRTQ